MNGTDARVDDNPFGTVAEPVPVPVPLEGADLPARAPDDVLGVITKGRGGNVEYVPWPAAAKELDKLFGVAGWRMVCTRIKEVGGGDRTELVWMGYLIAKGLEPALATTGNGFMYPGGMGWRDAYESAESRALTKAAGRLGIFRDTWLKEQAAHEEQQAKGPPRRARPAQPQPAQPANGKPAPSKQKQGTPSEQARRHLNQNALNSIGLKSLAELAAWLGVGSVPDWFAAAKAAKVEPMAAAELGLRCLVAVGKELKGQGDHQDLPAAVAVVEPLAQLTAPQDTPPPAPVPPTEAAEHPPAPAPAPAPAKAEPPAQVQPKDTTAGAEAAAPEQAPPEEDAPPPPPEHDPPPAPAPAPKAAKEPKTDGLGNPL